jgi:Flp pilus assembly protein TadG
MPPRRRLLRLSARTRGWGEDGAAAVELALVLPVLLLLVFGVIDFGRALQQQMQLTEAVREAARVGALNGTAAAMQAQVSGVVGSGVTPTYTQITPCPVGAAVGTDAVVKAKFTYSAATPLFSAIQYFGGTATGITISATGQMACLG